MTHTERQQFERLVAAADEVLKLEFRPDEVDEQILTNFELQLMSLKALLKHEPANKSAAARCLCQGFYQPPNCPVHGRSHQ